MNRELVKKENFDYGRPIRPESIPLALLHEVFGQFMEDVKTYKPTRADNKFMEDLRGNMVQLYDDEQSRTTAFRTLFEQNIPGFRLDAAMVGGGYISDGHYRLGDFHLVFTEGKNELDGMSTDPLLQAAMYYIQGLEARKELPDPFPCLLIYYAGKESDLLCDVLLLIARYQALI